MDSTKCLACGLVNLSDALVCKRCHATLNHPFSPPIEEPVPQFGEPWAGVPRVLASGGGYQDVLPLGGHGIGCLGHPILCH